MTLEMSDRLKYISQEKSEEMLNEAAEASSNADDGIDLLFASLYATVLEDSILQIRILGECNSKLRITKTMIDMPTLTASKFGVAQPAATNELDLVGPNTLWKEEYKLEKLDKDRNYFHEMLLVTYLDLCVNKSFQALKKQIDVITQLENYLTCMLQDQIENKGSRRELQKQLRCQRNHVKSAAYDMDQVIDDLKTRVEDATLDTETRGRYVSNWERARSEQHHLMIKDMETTSAGSIELYKQKLDHEQRVHSEIELIINIGIDETLKKMADMNMKLDEDMDAMELKIQIMRINYQVTLENREELEKKYEDRDKLVKDWLHFKEERVKVRQYREKVTNAAITVQAWWRGLLVRRLLGPYKPAKKRHAQKGAKKRKR